MLTFTTQLMKAAQQKSWECFAIWRSFTSKLCWCPFCIVLLQFLTDLYNVSACAWAFWKPGSENIKKTGQYQSAPWSGSHDYAGQQQGGADAAPGSMEHWPRASFRWFVGMTGAPLILNFSCCGNNALDSWHIDIWRLVVRWNICLLRFWNLEFLTWVKYLQACFTLPLKEDCW